jgi:disulfide bond formation protein DsbB
MPDRFWFKAAAMLAPTETLIRHRPAAAAALVIAAGGAATILGALFFQYALGYAPCPLCLEQRIPYYIAIPLAAVIAAAALRKAAPRPVLVAGLAILAIIMLVGAGLGAYHAGIEWKWWAGPQDCSGPLTPLGAGGGLLNQLQETRVVRCDEAAWRFLGLSLAGYNFLISLALAGIAAWGIVATQRQARAYGSSSVSQ